MHDPQPQAPYPSKPLPAPLPRARQPIEPFHALRLLSKLYPQAEAHDRPDDVQHEEATVLVPSDAIW